MNDLDDWLNSLGISDPMHDSVTTLINTPNAELERAIQEHEEANPHPAENLPIVSDPPQQDEPANVSFTDDDINDILAENGFQESEYDEAEEIDEEDEERDENLYPDEGSSFIEDEAGSFDEDEAYDENQGEGRDLDAEEDADWQEAIDSGGIVPVPQEEALQAVQSVNDENYPEHNPDETTSEQEAMLQVAVAQAPIEDTRLLLTPNSSTLLLNDATSRFSGTEWYNEIQKARIILAGCGGIGSWTALQLARMTPATLFMYDDDIVEQANMSGQLYSQQDIGKAKVDAMADMIRSYTTMRNIYAIKDKFTAASEAGDIMICGFDNMVARNTFFHSWRKHLRDMPEEQKVKCLYLDGRLSIDTLQVFCITGDNDWAISEYAEKHLFSDSEADATQCSLKQTTYLACMIGSVIVNLFTNFTANLLNPIIPYDLPFFTEYDAQNMIFKTIK